MFLLGGKLAYISLLLLSLVIIHCTKQNLGHHRLVKIHQVSRDMAPAGQQIPRPKLCTHMLLCLSRGASVRVWVSQLRFRDSNLSLLFLHHLVYLHDSSIAEDWIYVVLANFHTIIYVLLESRVHVSDVVQGSSTSLVSISPDMSDMFEQNGDRFQTEFSEACM